MKLLVTFLNRIAGRFHQCLHMCGLSRAVGKLQIEAATMGATWPTEGNIDVTVIFISNCWATHALAVARCNFVHHWSHQRRYVNTITSARYHFQEKYLQTIFLDCNRDYILLTDEYVHFFKKSFMLYCTMHTHCCVVLYLSWASTFKHFNCLFISLPSYQTDSKAIPTCLLIMGQEYKGQSSLFC